MSDAVQDKPSFLSYRGRVQQCDVATTNRNMISRGQIKGIHKKAMNGLKVFGALLALLTVVGCASREELDVAIPETMSGVPQSIGNIEMRVVLNKSDWLFLNKISGYDLSERKYKGSDMLLNEWRNEEVKTVIWSCSEFADSAYAKRKAALILGRCVFTYDMGNYVNFDGVSGLIYNVAYLFSIPRKALTALRCSDGITGYMGDLVRLGVGFVASIVGVFAATITNTLCHPFETLANLTVGIAYIGKGGFSAWWCYLLHTNLLMSIWDLVWGAIVYPLWQAVVFWM